MWSWLAIAAFGLGAGPARATETGAPPGEALVHVEVTEQAGAYQAAAPLTFGVPFARGRVDDVAQLDAWRTDSGRTLPTQARALSRWPDGSARWALIDTRVELQAHEVAQLSIGIVETAAPPLDPFTLSVDARGVHRLDDGTVRWPLLEPHPDGDRVAGLGAELVDRFGHVWGLEVDPADVALIERGPLRTVARVRGAHRLVREAPDAEVAPPPIAFHTVTIWVHVLAGTGVARVEWSIENGPLDDPPGALAFRSYTLLAQIGDGPRSIHVPGSARHGDEPFSLEQFGADRADWTFEVAGRRLGTDRRGDLWAGVLADGAGPFVHIVESAENHPTRLSYEPGGPLRVGLLADGAGEEFWLDDATRKTFRLTLALDATLAARGAMDAAVDPVHIALDPVDVRNSGAWGDMGHLFVPGAKELARPTVRPRDPRTGWADWGEFHATNTHSSGSPRNRLSVFLEAVQSGRVEPFRLARARAWHALDLRPYHIRGFRAEEYPDVNLHEGVPHPNDAPGRRLGRSEMDARFREYKRDILAGGHGYNGFDPEHMTLDDVYELYLLTGSWPALDALRSAGEAMLTWGNVRGTGVWSSRTTGWTLRALVQCARATGDPRYLEGAARLVRHADAHRGKGEVKYLSRNPADPRHIADSESDDPWMVAVAIHGLGAYWAETADPIVPPMVADLVTFVMSAWTGAGFLPSIAVDEPNPTGVDTQPRGTSQWIPGALAVAGAVTGDHAAVDVVLPYYAARREEDVRFGSPTWHWWQPYLVSIRRRHGARAISDPLAVYERLRAEAIEGPRGR